MRWLARQLHRQRSDKRCAEAQYRLARSDSSASVNRTIIYCATPPRKNFNLTRAILRIFSWGANEKKISDAGRVGPRRRGLDGKATRGTDAPRWQQHPAG